MNVRSAIFDSKTEKAIYESMRSNWSPKFVVYPQVPLSKIVHMEYEEIGTFHRRFFPDLQMNYYYQAHVDYTICDSNGHPLFSIEFDGIRGGFSRDATYFEPGNADKGRKLRLDFKLKVATSVNYPLIVISYEENEPIILGDKLKIVDAIIGNCMASVHFYEQFSQNLKELVSEGTSLNDEEVQTLVWDTEVQTEMEWDPVARLAVEYHSQCTTKGFGGYSIEYITEPPLPDYSGPSDVEGMKRRAKALHQVGAVGCRVQVKTPSKTMVEEVLIRNFGAVCVDPINIAENIAKYRVFRKALQLL